MDETEPEHVQMHGQVSILTMSLTPEAATSKGIVTGPSFWMWTCIYAPNCPSKAFGKYNKYSVHTCTILDSDISGLLNKDFSNIKDKSSLYIWYRISSDDYTWIYKMWLRLQQLKYKVSTKYLYNKKKTTEKAIDRICLIKLVLCTQLLSL